MKTETSKAAARAAPGRMAFRGRPRARDLVIDLTPSRLSLKKILVPVDFSKHSEKAVRYAERLAEVFGASLVLLNVVEPVVLPEELGYGALQVPLLDAQAMQRATLKKLKALTRKVLKAPVKARAVVRSGSAAHEITSLAKRAGMDLIVLATHGYRGLKHLVLGSTAEKVVRHAPCPVLVVRAEERDFIGARQRGRRS